MKTRRALQVFGASVALLTLLAANFRNELQYYYFRITGHTVVLGPYRVETSRGWFVTKRSEVPGRIDVVLEHLAMLSAQGPMSRYLIVTYAPAAPIAAVRNAPIISVGGLELAVAAPNDSFTGLSVVVQNSGIASHPEGLLITYRALEDLPAISRIAYGKPK